MLSKSGRCYLVAVKANDVPSIRSRVRNEQGLESEVSLFTSLLVLDSFIIPLCLSAPIDRSGAQSRTRISLCAQILLASRLETRIALAWIDSQGMPIFNSCRVPNVYSTRIGLICSRIQRAWRRFAVLCNGSATMLVCLW